MNTGTSPLLLVSAHSLLRLNAHFLTLSAVRLCTESVFKWTTAIKFEIQLYEICGKERNQKHNEVKIAVSNPVLVQKEENKTRLAIIVTEQSSLRRENEAITYKRGQINDVLGSGQNSSSQCIVSRNMAPIDTHRRY
jgi:hypothetical protein